MKSLKGKLIAGIILVAALFTWIFIRIQPTPELPEEEEVETENNKPDTKELKKNAGFTTDTFVVKTHWMRLNYPAEAEVIPYSSDTIRFPVSGIVEPGEVNFSESTAFKFNQLLCKLDISMQYAAYSEQKKLLISKLETLLPLLTARSSESSDKWPHFVSSLQKPGRIPAFPATEKEEDELLKSEAINEHYATLQEKEQTIDQSYYLAPYNGWFIHILKKEGSSVRPNEPVAIISSNKKQVLCVKLPMSVYNKIDKQLPIHLQNESKTDKPTYYFSHKELFKSNFSVYYHIHQNVYPFGEKFEIEIPLKKNLVAAVPIKFLVDGELTILDNQGNKLQFKPDIVSRNADSIYVINLANNIKTINITN